MFNKMDYEKWIMNTSALLPSTGQHQSGCCTVGPWCTAMARRDSRRTTATPQLALWKNTRLRRLMPPTLVMSIRFGHMEGLQHVEKLKLYKCHYIKDDYLERLGKIETWPKSLLEIISCGNITDKGIICIT